MNPIHALAALALLAGCTSDALTNIGVPASSADKLAKINTQIATDGLLFCQIAGVVTAVPGVNVKGASAETVATACRTATILGSNVQSVLATPVAPPKVPTDVPVATVPMPVAAAVANSVGAPK